MPPVDTRVPLYVDVAAPATVTVVNDGNVSVYYQVQAGAGGSTISSTSNDGTVDPLNSLTVIAPTYFLAAAGGAQVTVTPSPPVVSYANGLVVNGQPVSAELFAQLTGTAADDVFALSAGTGSLLPAQQGATTALGSITGTVQLDLGVASDSLFTASASGDVTFTVVNANVRDAFVIRLAANTHTITWPTGTGWPNATPPTPSGGTDDYIFLVTAANSGVPTSLDGSYLLGVA